MQQYLEALRHILEFGDERDDRTGTGTFGVFGYQMRFNLAEGFPAVTTKTLAWKAVVSELLWFLEGSSDERRLAEILHGTRDASKRTIWTANAENQAKDLGYTDGELGPIYGVQWRNFMGPHGAVDQIEELVENLRADPYSRRHIISAWNAAEIDDMALPPCHVLSQFYVSRGKLSCQLYQRSADMFLGVPFNIASYALLTHILAKECGYEVGDFVWTGGDCHIYLNHMEQVHEQLSRSPGRLPRLAIYNDKPWYAYKLEDFGLEDYKPMPSIKAAMAV